MIAEGGIGTRYSTRIVGDLSGNILLMRIRYADIFAPGEDLGSRCFERQRPASPCGAGETPETSAFAIAPRHAGEALSI
jgi:hypothetical protein